MSDKLLEAERAEREASQGDPNPYAHLFAKITMLKGLAWCPHCEQMVSTMTKCTTEGYTDQYHINLCEYPEPEAEPKIDLCPPCFPLHDAWNRFEKGSNEHFAVACALGIYCNGLVPAGMEKPVKTTRPFFGTLIEAGLIDTDGHASKALRDERDAKKALNK